MRYAIIGSGVAGIAAIEAIRSVDGSGHTGLGTVSGYLTEV
jgi:hypothetical protein